MYNQTTKDVVVGPGDDCHIDVCWSIQGVARETCLNWTFDDYESVREPCFYDTTGILCTSDSPDYSPRGIFVESDSRFTYFVDTICKEG